MNYGIPAKALKMQIRMLSELSFQTSLRGELAVTNEGNIPVLEEEHGLSQSSVGEKAAV